MRPNDPDETRGFSLGFILCSMLMVGIIGLLFVSINF